MPGARPSDWQIQRNGGATLTAAKYHLDIISVGIENKRRIVDWRRLVFARSRSAIIFPPCTKIRPAHIIHSTIEDGLIPALDALYKVDATPLTPEQTVQSAAVRARGSRDPGIITEGTMGFTFTFPNGFTMIWFDSVGDPNAEERRLASELAPVDVAIFPWTPHPISETQLIYTFQHLQLFKPRLYLPDHHDSIWGVWLDNGLAPLFMKIRDDLPSTKFAEPLYRSAICVSTSGTARGAYTQSR